jgi:hypothetical protein
MIGRIALLFVVAVLFSCREIKIDAPLIDSDQLEGELSSIAPSTINLSTEIALQPYLRDAEKALDTKFSGEEKHCTGVSYQYHFYRNPLDFDFKQNQIKFHIDGSFDLNLSYCPGCHELFDEPTCLTPRIYASCGIGEPKRKVEISYVSQLGINEEFRLRSQTKLDKFKLIDPCKITVFQYDATETIEKEVRGALVNLEKEIDKQLASAPIRQTVVEVWKTLQDPILVAPYGYFYLRPNAIGIADLRLENDGKRACFSTQLQANPVFSTNALSLPVLPLPKNAQNEQSSANSILNLRTIASYDSINQLIAQQLGTQKIELTPKKIIQIDRVLIFGPQQERLLLAVDFSGTKKGRLYLIVSPFIDAQQHLKIKDVDFSIDTKSVLLHSARWLLDEKIKVLLTNAFDLDLNPIIDETRLAIEDQINGEIAKGVWMSGKIQTLTVQNLRLSPSHLSVDLQLTGPMKLKIE